MNYYVGGKGIEPFYLGNQPSALPLDEPPVPRVGVEPTIPGF